MRKSLQLQAEMTEEFGACVFDVTLDCEDGAPVGGEAEHAAMVVALALEAPDNARVAVRVHPVEHPSFFHDMALIAGKAGDRLTHIMVPKVESVRDVIQAEKALLRASAGHLPLHVLIESPAAVHRAFEIASHPRVQSLSFGLMDFVSAHGGAIPSAGMGVVGQFTQQSMSPYTEQLRTFAALFAGETGLTLDDLGFVTDNPSSAEAIKSSHESLRLAARKAQRTFGSGFLNAGYLAACMRDGIAYQRQQLYLTRPVWEPVFEPDAATLSGIGDAVGKINTAIPGYFGAENLRDLTGIRSES